MDDHVKVVEELFSAARAEFKHLEYYYFHNCLYEACGATTAAAGREQIPTHEVMNTYGSDYKCIFVGDASMSPYEIAFAGGANEHWNEEPGRSGCQPSAWRQRRDSQAAVDTGKPRQRSRGFLHCRSGWSVWLPRHDEDRSLL
jgi:hypothetical protein